jgi:hypothetical protein
MGCAAGGSLTDLSGQDSGTSPPDGNVTTDSPSGGDAPHLGGDGSADTKPSSDTASDSASDAASDEAKTDSGGDSASDTSDAAAEADASAKDTGPADTAKDSPPDAPKDTSTDTSTCVPVTLNSGTNDGGTCPAPVSGSCGMGDVAGFSPTWIPPSGYHQGLCTTTQIDDIYTGCLASGATDTTCSAAESAAPGCYDCIFTMEGTSPYGPIIETNNGVLEVNQAGCIALLEPCNTTCAEEVNAAAECESAACESNCPVTDNTSLDNFENCEATAASCDPNGCDTFATESTCENELTGASHPASICVSETDFEDFYNDVVPVFCGP